LVDSITANIIAVTQTAGSRLPDRRKRDNRTTRFFIITSFSYRIPFPIRLSCIYSLKGVKCQGHYYSNLNFLRLPLPKQVPLYIRDRQAGESKKPDDMRLSQRALEKASQEGKKRRVMKGGRDVSTACGSGRVFLCANVEEVKG
jgi:hypothetical protein